MNFKQIAKFAIREDLGNCDITTQKFIPKNKVLSAVAIVKEKGIICGVEHAIEFFRILNPKCSVKIFKRDGQKIKKGSKIFEIKGDKTILSAERTALNILQRMSGIATATSEFIKRTKNKKVKITDTRKTMPLLRSLEKYAVKCGGGINHRAGLFDAVLIKDNHIKAAGWENIKQNMAGLKRNKKVKFIEIEAQNFSEVKKATSLKPDIILLDNMKQKNIKKSILYIRKTAPSVKIEISGGINLSNISKAAKLFPDRISVGMLTHSPKALDISLEIK